MRNNDVISEVFVTRSRTPTIGSVPAFSFENNNKKQWEYWRKTFELFMKANDLEKEDDHRKCAILLQSLGTSVKIMEIFESFDMKIENTKYDVLLQKFEDYFVPRQKSKIQTRHQFFTRRQKPEESIADFATDLQHRSLTCEFGNMREELARDVFIAGIHSRYVFVVENLLAKEDSVSLDEVVETANNLINGVDHIQNISSLSLNTVESGSGKIRENIIPTFKQKNNYAKVPFVIFFRAWKKLSYLAEPYQFTCPTSYLDTNKIDKLEIFF